MAELVVGRAAESVAAHEVAETLVPIVEEDLAGPATQRQVCGGEIFFSISPGLFCYAFIFYLFWVGSLTSKVLVDLFFVERYFHLMAGNFYFSNRFAFLVARFV